MLEIISYVTLTIVFITMIFLILPLGVINWVLRAIDSSKMPRSLCITMVFAGLLSMGGIFAADGYWNVGEGYKEGVQTGIVNYAGEQGIIWRTFDVEMVSNTGATKTYEFSVLNGDLKTEVLEAVESGKPVRVYYESSYKAPKSKAATNHIIQKIEYIGG